jgi:hypothetical protein
MNNYKTTYKGYELEKNGDVYTTVIEDGMFTYSMLIDKHKTLKDARNRINRYIDIINNLYK